MKSRRRRVPSYVTRATAAAELMISLPTLYDWVRRGILPGPDAGFPRSNPRWRWSLIQAWMAGDRSDRPVDQKELFGKKRGPKRGAPNAGRPKKSSVEDGGQTVHHDELRMMTMADLDALGEPLDLDALGEPLTSEKKDR
jgi:hypothetical protein